MPGRFFLPVPVSHLKSLVALLRAPQHARSRLSAIVVVKQRRAQCRECAGQGVPAGRARKRRPDASCHLRGAEGSELRSLSARSQHLGHVCERGCLSLHHHTSWECAKSTLVRRWMKTSKDCRTGLGKSKLLGKRLGRSRGFFWNFFSGIWAAPGTSGLGTNGLTPAIHLALPRDLTRSHPVTCHRVFEEFLCAPPIPHSLRNFGVKKNISRLVTTLL